ncbi:hypothetical protein QBZ16_001734 [Prototheca wickerhamii]|uniref:Glucosidase 2 subunit beta n=1 Tax=Prototheca wickerhamii TaxID=3111 RepID=A0AAD9IDY6_PROWI|nr:hypothetical protein QBZ16_001734 [Prototheca wickerhamii]
MHTRGIAPEVRSRYKSAIAEGTFTCFSSGHSFPSSRINDDYCDCPDGSDEPGTSACSNGSFYCRNRGFEPKVVSSPFVDDGVCDCCDGSDEAPGRCQDTCVAAGEQKRQELTRQVAEAEAGLQKRQAYVQEAAQKIEAWRKEAASLQAEVATLDAESNRANEARDRVQGKLSDIEKDVRELEASLVASAADGEPKEGAESAGAGAEEAGAEGAGAGAEGPQPPAPAPAEPADAVDETAHEEDAETVAALEEDSAEALDDYAAESAEDETEIDWHGRGTEPWQTLLRKGKELESRKVASVLRALASGSARTKKGGRSRAKSGPAAAEVSSPELEHLRMAAAALKEEAADAQKAAGAAASKLAERRRALGAAEARLKRVEEGQYGPDAAWAVLDGRCVAAQAGKYTYEACLYANAWQRDGHGGTSGTGTMLGAWAGFSNEAPGPSLAFADGASCWNGPKRSLKARYYCGAEERLMCEYSAVFHTPAACSEESVALPREALRRMTAGDDEGDEAKSPRAHDEL